ncbi:MAG: hypothetical protein Q7T36_01455 [Fluviicoccus sp.]|uniref:hypothetical protein n=1 Tax=Fluviicoccus sp. TaxID=2003552 RepID=UPI002725BA42|nr:hypothetical protein [Fluviicoccus sp.]MDO8329121.1 hypothetical protein [Fluviicoccus sp.]
MSIEKEKMEQNILSCIFEDGRQCKITKTEQPDFILNYKGAMIGEVAVGIEITELYYDATSARLNNKKGYIRDLLEGQNIHKDDKSVLTVKEVKYFSQSLGGKPFNTKMLFLPNYTIDDYRNAFLRTLRKKHAKHANYNKSVNQSSLVIYDRENYSGKLKRQDFVRAFFNESVMEEIKISPFDEIYLITCFEGSNDEFYIQLKYCVLQNELYRLLEYIEKNSLHDKSKGMGLSLNDVFAEVLVKNGYVGIKKSECNQIDAVRCNRYAFNISEIDKKISVFDDFPKLTNAGVDFSLSENKKLFTTKSFRKFLKESKHRYVSFDVGFKVLRNWREG